jgi:hypothetical protein
VRTSWSFSYQGEVRPFDLAERLCIRKSMPIVGPIGARFRKSQDWHVSLAHRRLAIIDLSEAGSQPMVDVETGNRI